MLTIRVTAESSAPPERVLELGSDFSDWRADAWLNVTTRRLEVHERGDTFAEVTEGGTGPARWFWERSRYDWSQPGLVKQTVIDSNVVAPGSTWELRAEPLDGGSRVEMVFRREFQPGVKGAIGNALNHLSGSFAWGFTLRRALAAVEKRSV